jgi:hypothetical protein
MRSDRLLCCNATTSDIGFGIARLSRQWRNTGGSCPGHMSGQFNLRDCGGLSFQQGTDPLLIELTADIVLPVGQQLVLDGRTNVTIDGMGHTLSETGARSADGSTGSLEYVRIVGGSTGIVLRNIDFRDHNGSDPAAPNISDVCRVQNGLPNSWNQNACRPLVQVGSVSSAVNNLTLDNIDVNSYKTFQVNVESVNGFSISNSTFLNSSVFGVRFGAGLATNVTIVGNSFRRARTNAIIADHVNGLTITNNEFIDNHWDRQFSGCNGLCSGGQVLINSKDGLPTSNVTFSNNLIDITPSGSPDLGSATGLEIAPQANSVMSNVVIATNRIYNVGRQGIQVHQFSGDTTPNQPNIVNMKIDRNDLANIGRHFAWTSNDLERYISLQGNTGLVVDGNRIGQVIGNWTSATFLTTPATCPLNGAATCAIDIKWSVTKLPAGSSPVVKVTNLTTGTTSLFSTGPTNVSAGANWTRTQRASWISSDTFAFSLFLTSTDTEPAAVLVVKGI